MSIYLSSAYLAPVQYYSKLLLREDVFIDANEHYQKQSYRNRCNIVAANGLMPLSIPVEHSARDKTATKDIRIAKHGNWQHTHWNAIVSAYNSSPFFEYYQDDFRPFYHTEFEFLFDFNEQLQDTVLRLLNIKADVSISYCERFKAEFESGEIDLRDLIHPKKDWQKLDIHFRSVPYYQVFDQRHGFVDNVSIIDLLFNMGNESEIVLRKSNIH